MSTQDEFMGTNEAAAYLNMPVATLKYHVKHEHIKPLKIGRTLLYTKVQLDEFAAQPRPKRGPKPKAKE